MAKQSQLIIVLAAVLLAVIAASAAVLFVLPGETGLPGEPTVAEPADTPPAPTSGGTTFDLRVLQKAGYVSLDKRPLTEGAVPVQPPANVGKANPFL